MEGVPLTHGEEFRRLALSAQKAYRSRDWIKGLEREAAMWRYYRCNHDFREDFRQMAQRFNWLKR